MRSRLYVIIILLQIIHGLLYASPNNFSQLKKLQNQNGIQVSALVVNLKTQKIIAQLSPDLRLSPASVTKLALGAKALDTWGPQKTFQSKIFMRGTLKNRVLNGDLIFYGGGDPYLTNEKLWFLTTDVARFGISKITGKIIVNNSFFGLLKQDASRFYSQAHSTNAYDAPLSSCAVNFSIAALVVSPAQKSGNKALVELEPYALPHVKIINKVSTIKTGSSKIFVERNSKNGLDVFTVSGTISVRNPQIRVYRSISNADLYAGEVIQAFLNHSGVQTSGKIQIENNLLQSNDLLISSVEGFPLNWQLKALFEMSNNFIADMLTLNLGHENQTQSLLSSSEILTEYMNEVIKNNSSSFSIVSHSNKPLVFKSGSGLSPENRLSAQDIIVLLSQEYLKADIFPDFLNGLAVPGGMGTLKKRFSKLDINSQHVMLKAKTGTLSEPQNVVSLAGYSRIKNEDWIAFAFITNSMSKSNSTTIESLRTAIDSDLLNILSQEQN